VDQQVDRVTLDLRVLPARQEDWAKVEVGDFLVSPEREVLKAGLAVLVLVASVDLRGTLDLLVQQASLDPVEQLVNLDLLVLLVR